MRIALVNLLLIVLLISCGKKSESMTNEEKISGNDSKTWEAVRETTSSGDKDPMSRAEKKETITFSRDGNVKMSNNNEMMAGTWSYVDNTLSLQFAGASVTENFSVVELEADKMKLLAADGSQLTLEPR